MDYVIRTVTIGVVELSKYLLTLESEDCEKYELKVATDSHSYYDSHKYYFVRTTEPPTKVKLHTAWAWGLGTILPNQLQ